MQQTEDHAVELTTILVKLGSYFGAAFSVGAALTLTQWGILVGILTAIITAIGNIVFQRRRDKREVIQLALAEKESEMRMAVFMQKGFHPTPEQQDED